MKTDIAALVPVKDPHQAKTRLARLLTPHERSVLVQTMLQDVLATLVQVTDVTAMVVTSDNQVRQIAAGFGLSTIADQGVGESAVIEAATRHVVELGASGSLVVPGDVPLVGADEVRQMLAAAQSPGSVLVPSRDGRGSNGVLRMPPDLFHLRFGDDSFMPHLARARDTGCSCAVLRLPGLGLDVDCADDVRQLLARGVRCRTYDYLFQSELADRIMINEHV